MNSIDGWTHLMEKANLIILLKQSVLVKQNYTCVRRALWNTFSPILCYTFTICFNGNRNRLEKYMHLISKHFESALQIKMDISILFFSFSHIVKSYNPSQNIFRSIYQSQFCSNFQRYCKIFVSGRDTRCWAIPPTQF